MKKMINFAVVALMSVLCAVVMWSCSANSEYDVDGQKNVPVIKPKARFLKCIVPRINYGTTGVVVTRGIEGIPEGTIDILSYHEATWMYGADTIYHTYQGRFIQKFYDVKRTRYAYNIDIFKDPVMKPQKMEGDSILWTVTFKDTDTHDFDISILELPAYYENDYYQVGDSLMKLCKNAWVTRELIDAKVNSATSPDDKYDAYSVDLYFQFGVEEGPDNKKTCMVTLPLVLVPKAGPDVPLPEEKHDIIAFEEVDKGYDLVNDSINNRWIDLEKVFSDGSREPFPRVAFVSKNHLYAPEYQIKQVDDFDWKSSPMKSFDATPSGDWQKRENNIYVMPMTQSCATYTDKGTCIFNGDFDGQAYFVDSLGQKHYFLYKEYTFEDDGWQRSDMQPTENFERKLLSSDIRGFFNGATLPRTGEIELRKTKEEIKIIGYSYPEDEKGLEAIVPNESYKTWRNQYTVFSNGKKEFNQKVWTTLYLKTVAPQKQTVTVSDWEINDLTAQDYKASRGESRIDKQQTGTFTITTWVKNYVTRTNKSEDKFVTTYDGTVKFVDKYENEVEFISLAVSQQDLGGTKTLKDLMDQDGYERKLMTTSVAVTETHTSTSANHTAEVEFRKVKPEDPHTIRYEYKDFDIKPIIPNKQYYTYCTRYAVKSDGTSENLGTLGTDLYINVTEPAKQTITVTDWNINDQKATLGSAVPKGSRNDPQNEGVFKISKSEKSYTTRTNKSECNFVISYEGTVTFTDTFGKETAFKGITISASDNGGVNTMRDLPEQGGLERKEMTSNVTVTVNSTDNDNYNGIVEFRKAVEKEELLSWDKEQTLNPAGNGLWTSTTTIIYNWKLAGRKTEPISVTLDCSIVGEPKSHVILAEAKAPYKTFNEGGWGNPTKSYPYDGVTVVTSSKSYTEDYTNLNDKYTAKMSTASFEKVVDGKKIAFEFLSPSSMNISHASDNLVDGKRTTTDGGITYDVYDHTGSVTATVTGNGKSQTQSAKDEKEIWVKHNEPAVECKYGFVDATLVFNPNVSIDNSKGGFHVCIALKGKSEWIIAVTRTYGNPNAADFDTYRFPFTQVPSSYKINSAILWDGHWIPAYLSGFGQNWAYGGYNDQVVNMNMNFAETCGIKNFTGSSTAENTARLNYTYRVTDDGTLHVYNHKGGEVYSIK